MSCGVKIEWMLAIIFVRTASFAQNVSVITWYQNPPARSRKILSCGWLLAAHRTRPSTRLPFHGGANSCTPLSRMASTELELWAINPDYDVLEVNGVTALFWSRTPLCLAWDLYGIVCWWHIKSVRVMTH